MSRKAMIVSALLLGVFLAGAAMAQDVKKPANYPVKPVTLQVGWPAGGGSDRMLQVIPDRAASKPNAMPRAHHTRNRPGPITPRMRNRKTKT